MELVGQEEAFISREDYGRQTNIKANSYTFSIPFTGDGNLFNYRASTFTYSPPRGVVKGNELHLNFVTTDHDASDLRQALDRKVQTISEHLSWIKKDVIGFNDSLRPKIFSELEKRKEKLLKDQNIVASLGIPIRQRTNSPKTYSTPILRKKISFPKPNASQKPFKPEPELEKKIYDQIIDTLRNMVLVMERSPHAFANMGEDDLRTHFLVQLNGIFEGQATGETFNFEGKTDILIRVEGKNIFIGECKFWTGPKGLQKTIDQLLGYLSWRDTKVAILLFNRNKEFTKVLSQIPTTVKNHPNFKKNFTQINDTEFSFVLKSNIDENRLLLTTLLAFDIPKD